jgi:hypothetical protein
MMLILEFAKTLPTTLRLPVIDPVNI